jgi:hypothetical protein
MTDSDTTESIPLRLLIKTGLLLVILATASVAQNVKSPSDEIIDGVPRVEVTRRIFEGEQATMRRLRIYSPIVETYIQSVWPDTAAQMPIDDLYFLGKVDMSSNFLVGDEGNARLFGRSEESRRVLDDTGQRQELYPAGFIHMLFIDRQSFDSDTYRLTYLQPTTLGALHCLLFAVDPIKPDTSGTFRGKVWVEENGLKVVRVQGTFQVERLKLRQRINPLRRSAGFFIRFDCWRQIIAADLWAPAYVNMDDNIPWKAIGGDGTTDLHYRGHVFVWGYSHLGSFEGRPPQRTEAEKEHDQIVAGLERDGLVGPPENIERSLNEIVEEIAVHNHLNLSLIRCRVLLTTHVEMFHSSNTILISRGLLDMVPDKSTLAVLLGHEMAHVLLEDSVDEPSAYKQSLFEYGGPGEFPGFAAFKPSDEGEAAAAKETCTLLKDSPYVAAVDDAFAFVSQLAAQSAQIPNLTRARFGAGLVEGEHLVHHLQSCSSSGQPNSPAPHLQLAGRYAVDAWTGVLRSVP